MADITDLIAADHRRLLSMQQELRETARDGPGSRPARAWDRVAEAVELHMAAEDELCWLPGLGTGREALALIQEVAADHGDIREAVLEARLQPLGSAAWRRSARAAAVLCEEHFRWEERIVLAELRRCAPAPLRAALVAQWTSFQAARQRDLRPAG